MIQIIGTSRNADTRQAIRWFKERRIEVQFRNLSDKALARGEIDNIARSLGADSILDREGSAYSRRGLAWMEFDPVDEILRDNELLKQPVVREKNRMCLGLDTACWEELTR